MKLILYSDSIQALEMFLPLAAHPISPPIQFKLGNETQKTYYKMFSKTNFFSKHLTKWQK
jgi:hypothetical protein